MIAYENYISTKFWTKVPDDIIPLFMVNVKDRKDTHMNYNINVNEPEMLSVNDTAEKWGISKHYARQLALSGTVKAVRIGKGKILINQL